MSKHPISERLRTVGSAPTQHPTWAVSAEIVSAALELDRLHQVEEQHAAMLDALRELIALAERYLDEAGGCDHSVNICMCDVKRTIENARYALPGGAEQRAKDELEDEAVLREEMRVEYPTGYSPSNALPRGTP